MIVVATRTMFRIVAYRLCGVVFYRVIAMIMIVWL
jgi:hypothetical protein